MNETPLIHYARIDSPLGQLLLVARGATLVAIDLPAAKRSVQPRPDWREDRAALAPIARQLDQYFAGRRREFDLAVAPAGTPFQQAVWAELRRIPYGITASYGEIAGRIGRPAASRAVGAANGRNPIPIVIPCHRVIGRDGSLTGFGGGIDAKRHLLDLECAGAGIFGIGTAAPRTVS